MRDEKAWHDGENGRRAAYEPPTMKTVSEMNLLQSLAPVWGYNGDLPFEFN